MPFCTRASKITINQLWTDRPWTKDLDTRGSANYDNVNIVNRKI
jgi:hypothetical protein